ncbi:type VI secretion system baseplate subunit TssG [Shewanella khirikhana]|nr:type VI secretion system baseplate subunit TssG [Shewanella khirikhana]
MSAQAPLPVPERYRQYNFFQLVELLHKVQNQDPQKDDWEREGRLTFRANPSLGFAAADISDLTQLHGRVQLETCFMGLGGAQSPLPNYMLDMLLEDEEGIRTSFLDFFSNRLTSLLYRSWRKYRYYVQFQHDARDQFSAQVFSLVGLSSEHLRADSVINWSKMLAYAGTLAGRSRSAQVLSGIVAHSFDLTDVSVREWQFRWVAIPADQRSILGISNMQLGQTTLLGEKTPDVSGKFVLCIGQLAQERFRELLPSGREFEPLCRLVELVLREQMAFDLELTIRDDEEPVLRLDCDGVGQLGWSSFLGTPKVTQKRVLIQIRE